ncbi:hypothetical protein E4U27_002341 [Claviceps purpurea]|nr:hypothetical protein E4U27_002341 [Claviceps purpurea]
MASQPQSDTNVFLRDKKDWTPWINLIHARASAYNFQSKLDPDCPDPYLEEPTLPELPNLSAYSRPSDTPEPTRPSELAPQGLKAYQEDMAHYAVLTKEYELKYPPYAAQQQALQNLVELIQTTVSPHLQRTCCLSGQPLREWISNLKLTLRVDSQADQYQAYQRYKAALKPMRDPQDWDAWLTEYDEAAAEATLLGVASVSRIGDVINDFLDAVQWISEGWTASFMNCGMRDPLMTRQKMTNRFREYMSVTHPLPVRKHRTGATTAAAAADEDSYSSDGSESARGGKRDASSDDDSAPCAKRTKRVTGSASRTNHQESSNTRAQVGGAANGRRRCPACIRGHDLKDCYYIHKDRAPRWWRPDESMAAFIEKRRKHDAAFEELLRASG